MQASENLHTYKPSRWPIRIDRVVSCSLMNGHAGESCRAIARTFHVHHATISRLARTPEREPPLADVIASAP